MCGIYGKELFLNIIYRFYDCGIIESTGSREEKMSMSNIAGTVIIDANTANISSNNYFDAYNGEGARVSYTVGIIPLWQVFVCLTICTLYKYIKNRPKRAALKKKVAKL